MKLDISWKTFLLDNSRYADIINGFACNGKQVITGNSLYDTQTKDSIKINSDTQTGNTVQTRDSIKKAAFGVNFAIIGIENQETVNYSMPLRAMSYDLGEYEKQASKLRKNIRQQPDGLNSGEYLYGFKKDSRLYPVITFILYAGTKPWDGAASLHEILDFNGIPEELRKMSQNYKINLIEIRKLKDTSVYKTDVRQVFDFIRCSEDKSALRALVENDEYYRNMEEDAFNVAAHYTNADELIATKEYHKKGDKVNMCTAIKELIADGRIEGAISICRDLQIPDEVIFQKIQEKFSLSKEAAEKYLYSGSQ